MTNQDKVILNWITQEVCNQIVAVEPTSTISSYSIHNAIVQAYEYGKDSRIPLELAAKIMQGE